MEIYKLWLSDYENKKDVTIFSRFNSDEVMGILKIYYIVKPKISNFIFTITKTSAIISSSNNKYSNFYKDILPYADNRDIYFYIKKYNLNDKIYVIINMLFNNNIVKKYLLLLDNMNQLYGCVLGLEIFNIDVSNITKIGNIIDGEIKEIKIPNISFKERIVKNI